MSDGICRVPHKRVPALSLGRSQGAAGHALRLMLSLSLPVSRPTTLQQRTRQVA